MILELELISKIFNDHPNKASLDFKKEKSKILKAHITGIGAKELLSKVDEFERQKVSDQRKKLSISNVDLFNRIMTPRKKIFIAKGGIEVYNLATPKLSNEFKEYIANVTGQGSLKKYIKDIWQKRCDYDPEGLKWVELNESGVPYPAFKSIQSIYEWQLNGRRLEYVFFELNAYEIKYYALQGFITGDTRKLKIYRVVCDKYDRLVSFDGGKSGAKIIYEIENPFGFVPGEILSDIAGEEGDGNGNEWDCYQSPINPIAELLSKYMYHRSVQEIALARMAYPKEWMNKFTCPTCNGKKKMDSGDCPECSGTGVIPVLKNSDVAIVEYANDANKNVPTPPMGTVDTPTDGLQFMKDNALSLEEMMNLTIWGTFKTVPGVSSKVGDIKGRGGNVSNTAYEAAMTEESKNDALREMGDWVAASMKWYVDIAGVFMYGERYTSSAILMGDRYMMESSDATFDRLDKARIGGSPRSQLNSLQIEFLENKYKNNPIYYWKYYVLFIAEPFMWEKTSDVLGWDIPISDKMKKIFFDEWVCTLSDDYFIGLPKDGVEAVVKADLEKYVVDRYQKGVETDNLFFTAMGLSLNVGDIVKVKQDKSLMPEHAGKSFKIKSVNAQFVTMVDDNGNQIEGYSRYDVQKTQNIRGGAPYGMR